MEELERGPNWHGLLHKPEMSLNHISKLREKKMDTVGKHTEADFTSRGRLNFAV